MSKRLRRSDELEQGRDSAVSQNVKLPTFHQLPLSPEDPPFSAWGLWGKDDQLGRLNLQTPGVTLAAKDEIQTGEAISLK